MNIDRRLFCNPPAEYRAAPFWCWNGELTRDELIRQVHVLKDMGFGGFFMHSRTGLRTEYLGEKWLELVRACTEEAARLGMNAWLYDEDRWPSGTAGGAVTEDPDLRMKFISLYFDGETPDPECGDTLAAFDVKLDADGTLSDYRPAGEAGVPSGWRRCRFLRENMACRDFYNGTAYLDTMYRPATEKFIELTHEKYARTLGEHFGKALVGVFTDEPYRGSLLSSFGLQNKNSERMLPYTFELFGRYLSDWGEDLRARLPELFFGRADGGPRGVMFRYIETLTRLYLENFERPYLEWCRAHKLVLTGHVLHEDNLTAQTLFVGSVQRCYEYFDCPGMDNLGEFNRAGWVAKQVQSVARELGRPFALSELYGATGWQMTFENYRDAGLWQTLFGVNFRCPHLSWYTMKGEAKRDYPASISFQSAWHKDYAFLETYFARAGYALSCGEPLADTLVISPVESMWLFPRLNWTENFFTPVSPRAKALEEDYAALFGEFAAAGVDFDYGDEGLLAEYGGVSGAGLSVGARTYRRVVLSGNITLRSSTLDLLKRFAESGGEIAAYRVLPSLVDGEPAAGRLDWLNGCPVYGRGEKLRGYLASGSRYRVTGGEVWMAVRRDGAGETVALLNPEKKKTGPLVLRLAERADVEEWNAETGGTETIAAGAEEVPFSLESGALRILRVLPAGSCAPPRARAEGGERAERLSGPFDYSLSEPNVLPLDRASAACGTFSCGTEEVLRIDRALRAHLGYAQRGGEMIQPWLSAKRGEGAKRSGKTLCLTFRFRAERVPDRLWLALEDADVWSIALNGTAVAAAADGWWVDPCFTRVPIDRALIAEGENLLTLSAEMREDLDIEACYLLGEFGVRAGEVCALTALPEKLSVGDLAEQGLPFYGGAVRLRTGIGNGRVRVRVPGYRAALAKAGDGAREYPLAFAPCESPRWTLSGELWIELVMTRRNTFGPLHLASVTAAGGYGPEIFRLEGEYFTENYAIVPQGLAEPAEVFLCPEPAD